MDIFQEINFNNEVTAKTLRDTINNNKKSDSIIQKKILESEEYSIGNIENNVASPKKKKNKSEKELSNKFSEDINYYLSMINGITDFENLEEKIAGILPSKTEVNYHMVILRLKVELLKNIKEINELIDGENLSIDELQSFKQDIGLENEKINTLAIIEERKNYKEVPKQENIIVFAKTAGENIRVLEEISSKAIDPAYYNDFKILFNSIKNGTFNGFKKFHSSGNSKIRGYQLRKDDTRLVFDRVGDHTYVVITAFVKKCANDRDYKESLQNKLAEYSNQRKELINKLNDDSFIKQNQEYERILFQKLNNIATEKTYRKRRK